MGKDGAILIKVGHDQGKNARDFTRLWKATLNRSVRYQGQQRNLRGCDMQTQGGGGTGLVRSGRGCDRSGEGQDRGEMGHDRSATGQDLGGNGQDRREAREDRCGPEL